MVSIFCFFKSFGRRFTSWYRYLVKPVLLLICLMAIVTASVCMGNMPLRNEEFLFALFFIIFPAILFLVIAFIPSRIFETPAQAYATAVPQVSPFKRVWALLLSAGIFLGVGGLHRFYVGKIGTGILWLLTWGLFGFGQFIDVIMIILGQFKDCYGRRLTIWENFGEQKDFAYANEAARPQNNAAGFTEKTQSQDSQKDAVDQHPDDSSTRIIMIPSPFQDFHPFAFLLSSIGYIFLLVAILVGLAVALHLPAMIAAGFPDPSLAKELNHLFGYTGWPQLLEHIGIAVVTILLVLAVIFIIIARRKSGPFHIIRAVLGLLGFLAALLFLSECLPRYPQEVIDMLNSNQLGPALEKLLKSTGEDEAVMALILFVASVIILAWPPGQKQPVFKTVAQNQEVIS
jgi:TM2 domain-containing membrane protein YozV